MPLLPPIAVDRNAAGKSWSRRASFLSRRDDLDTGHSDIQREFLIKEGAHCGDFLHFHVSGESFASTYIVGHQIGEGGFGKVFVAIHKVTGIKRAVKRLDKEHRRQELHKNELDALLALDHPHIVKLLEYYDEEEYLYLVFELCEGIDLFEAIKEAPAGRLSEYDASVSLRHMLKALQCCHAQYRGHYDIKPENFMFKSSSRSNLKMVDLGLSSCFDMHRKHKVAGTSPYMAPEFWDGIYGPEGDVWSCGVVLFVMLTGQSLADGVPSSTMKREVRVRKLLKERLQYAATKCNLSSNAQDLLKAMLQHDRHARPTIKEALKHPFNTESYEIERRLGSKDGEESYLREAIKILRRLPDTVRCVVPEPMLKRVARLIMVHVCEVSESCSLAFRMLDLHGYGELSVSALENERVGNGKPCEDVDTLFEAMDLNRDGYISYRAFLSITLPLSIQNNRNLLQVAFAILDSDKDGFITMSDLAKIFGHGENSEVCRATISEVSSDGRVALEQFLQFMKPPEAPPEENDTAPEELS